MKTLNVGLDAWIIQDGNYPDFNVGDEVSFALECRELEVSLTKAGRKEAKLICWSEYEMSGEVVYVTPEISIIDFGFKAFRLNSEDTINIEEGQWVKGEFYLGVDPFHYRDNHSKAPGAPDISLRLKITGIDLETTPWNSKLVNGLTLYTRDYTRKGYKPVQRTNALLDDDHRASYILKCEVISKS